METSAATLTPRSLLSKVAAVTANFWIIKLQVTTVGETAADFLGINLNRGEAWTCVIAAGVLAGALVGFGTTTACVLFLSLVLLLVVASLLRAGLGYRKSSATNASSVSAS